MRVLLVGGGGREHALARAIAESPSLGWLVVTPGNPGIGELPKTDLFTRVNPEDPASLTQMVLDEEIDFVVVGPEAPLVAGVADRLAKHNIPVFGPTAAGARLEGSKIWAKELMRQHGIPTAPYRTFTDPQRALAYGEDCPLPVVVKADGLAAGKGVVVARDRREVMEAVRNMMVHQAFGAAGKTVLFEDAISGPEVSVLAITDGESIIPLPSARDHKPVFDDNKGPNTGGMGVYSPAPVLTDELAAQIDREVLVPILHALRTNEITYRGVIYAGMMLTRGGPRVLEFNVRFGDPETQAVLPRLKGDVLAMLHAAATGRLHEIDPPEIDDRVSVDVVLCSGGYPGAYKKGLPITGVAEASAQPDVFVYHAGTAKKDGKLVTNGGRVLNVVALGATHEEARQKAYAAADMIQFEGMHRRSDIAASLT